MLALRFLSGPRVGESIRLRDFQVIGRDEHCEIVVKEQGISKKHAEIRKENGQWYLRDLNSSNGTYLNGVRVKAQKIKIGDKISFYQVLCEVTDQVENVTYLPVQRKNEVSHKQNSSAPLTISSSVNAPVDPSPQMSFSYDNKNVNISNSEDNSIPKPSGSSFNPDHLMANAIEFLDKKVVKDVYSLADKFSFKTIFLSVAILFIIIVTSLSIIPLYIVTEESIKNESFLRALSVARSVAQVNENRLRSGELQKFSTDLLYQERGIEEIYVVGKDGVVLAPMELAGSMPKQVQFVRDIRGQPREFVVDKGGIILAAVPIIGYDPNQQINVAMAHVVVHYRSDVFKFREERVLSLFVQVLLIGFVVGAILFFVLYKVIEYALRQLYEKVDEAVRSGADQVHFHFNFPIVQDLLTIVNSLLMRANEGHNVTNGQQLVNRFGEYVNVCSMIPFPSVLASKQKVIEYVNPAFQSLVDIPLNQQKIRIDQLPDMALQQNLNYLIDQASVRTQEVVKDQLEIGGSLFQLSCQALSVSGLEPDYFLISISPSEQGT
ncbi:MAG: FHA domain-containing protein [Bdellovibrionaceae bacterium]|nr:FHA domain-containing protein [Pseudobdellovibrionaceae bacterium]MDW8189550.1 FHA domain-containing protein [Pseudobdellovibrionaceae bacterium]